MQAEKWGIEITIRVLHLVGETDILKLPNGITLGINDVGDLSMVGLKINTCVMDIEKIFALAVSYNNDEGKLTTRICQGSDT